MTHYMINFSVYTMAMIGLIIFALFVFKKCSGDNFSRKNSSLDVLDTMKLSPRKTLYVIKANDEKFLIAADMDNTSLIAKLDENNEKIEKTENKITFSKVTSPLKREDKSSQLKSFDGLKSMKEFSSVIDFKPREKKGPVMKELAKKLKVNN